MGGDGRESGFLGQEDSLRRSSIAQLVRCGWRRDRIGGAGSRVQSECAVARWAPQNGQSGLSLVWQTWCGEYHGAHALVAFYIARDRVEFLPGLRREIDHLGRDGSISGCVSSESKPGWFYLVLDKSKNSVST